MYSAGRSTGLPIVTDTFGMTVLEAQACGLPALVSDKGGPQKSSTMVDGFVIPAIVYGSGRRRSKN